MNKLSHAINTYYFLEANAQKANSINRLHPLSKVLTTFIYISCTVSFPKYALFPLLTLSIYLMVNFTLADLSLKRCFNQLKWLFVLVSVVGVFNPFFDRTVILRLGIFPVTTGMISMLTLMLKGSFALMASYLLICTTSMEAICYTLKKLHIPDPLTTALLLGYRHLLLLLTELQQMLEAYLLRSNMQKGLHVKAWGSFIGYFLLRSMDRSEAVAESMLLRGYRGNLIVSHSHTSCLSSFLYVCIWTLIFLLLRFILS